MIDLEVIREPVFCLKIKNFFKPEENKAILDEALSNQKEFKPAKTVGGKDEYWRKNLTCMYNDIYNKRRDESTLLTALHTKLTLNEEFTSMLKSSEFPLTEIASINNQEVSVARYGEGDHYLWHQDRNDEIGRMVTIVYYFFKEPQIWTGGELCLTNSPQANGVLLEKNPKILCIEPENNMALIYSYLDLHCVYDTHATNEFSQGRFAANIILGINRGPVLK